MMNKLQKILIATLIALGLALPAAAEKIVMEGSTTVLPIAQKAAEVYMNYHSDADISVRGGGSGVGIAAIIDGSCDIANSSRAIKESELEKGVANGKQIKANVIAMDGIAAIVNPGNKLNALAKEQLKAIYTGSISNWSQLGGDNQKIVVISRDTSSGTFEAFGTLVLDGAKVRPDALMQASNQAVASIVSRTPGAIGYVGLGFMSSGVKALEIDGVRPSAETVLTGKYVIGRPLFMYTNGEPKGLVKAFLDFIKSAEGQKLAEEEGFVALK